MPGVVLSPDLSRWHSAERHQRVWSAAAAVKGRARTRARYRQNTGATITTVRQIERPASDHRLAVPRRAPDRWPGPAAVVTSPAGTENQVASGEIRRIEPGGDLPPTDRRTEAMPEREGDWVGRVEREVYDGKPSAMIIQ